MMPLEIEYINFKEIRLITQPHTRDTTALKLLYSSGHFVVILVLLGTIGSLFQGIKWGKFPIRKVKDLI